MDKFTFRIEKVVEIIDRTDDSKHVIRFEELSDYDPQDVMGEPFYSVYARKEGHLELCIWDSDDLDTAMNMFYALRLFHKLVEDKEFDLQSDQ
jgi:hypothetical protein